MPGSLEFFFKKPQWDLITVMENKIDVISIKESPQYLEEAISTFQRHWANEKSLMVYDDCLRNCITSTGDLPQWYLLRVNDMTVGCVGLITNDFISRMDLYPWICGLYIEKEFRGNEFGSLLLKKAVQDAHRFGYNTAYLCTDHEGYYEKYGFKYLAIGYHPWGETSKIYYIET